MYATAFSLFHYSRCYATLMSEFSQPYVATLRPVIIDIYYRHTTINIFITI